MKTKKDRLDLVLVERELVETRSRAKGLIMAGNVFVNDVRIDKAGTMVANDAQIELKGVSIQYASRGGLKLKAAIDAFGFECEGLKVIDVGASTGGFTDCVLQEGATIVYAVDVGYGQLAWKLRSDDRVVVLERCNIRYLEQTLVPVACDLAVIDCSFISLQLVIPPTRRFLSTDASVIALIKPQFEVGRERLGKGGVVRDPEFRRQAIEGTIAEIERLGLMFHEGIDCPVHGPAGNIEYLARFTNTDHPVLPRPVPRDD